MNTPQWVSGPHPQKWTFKKDMPSHLRHEARRIDFGLFGISFIALDVNGHALMRDGQRAPLLEFYLCTPGHVIGHRDMQAASHKDWAFEWQTACADKMMDQVNLRINSTP